MAELAKNLWFRTDIIPPTAVKIYTTVAETGSTVTLPLKVDGVQGYVGLVDKSNSLWTPIKVKKGGTTYYAVQEGKPPVPTGNTTIYGDATFTVPAGVKVVKCNMEPVTDITYIGVTPGQTYHIVCTCTEYEFERGYLYEALNKSNYKGWYCEEIGDTRGETTNQEDFELCLAWSPEINKKTTNFNDY